MHPDPKILIQRLHDRYIQRTPIALPSRRHYYLLINHYLPIGCDYVHQLLTLHLPALNPSDFLALTPEGIPHADVSTGEFYELSIRGKEGEEVVRGHGQGVVVWSVGETEGGGVGPWGVGEQEEDRLG